MEKVLNFPANKIAKGVHTYYPDMGDRRINAQLEARLSYNGSHYFVDSPHELKGRGITFIKTYTADHFIRPSRLIGWHSYKVTQAAFEKLKQEYSISMERLLD